MVLYNAMHLRIYIIDKERGRKIQSVQKIRLKNTKIQKSEVGTQKYKIMEVSNSSFDAS